MRFWCVAICMISLLIVGCSPPSIFNKEEQAYIDSHIINWAAEDNYQPFIFTDNSVPKGIAADYLELIIKKSGLKIRLEKSGQLEEILELLNTGPVDLVTSIRTTPDRSKYADFSRPFIYVDLVQLKRTAFPITTGVTNGSAVVNFLKVERKDLLLIEFDNDEAALNALINDDVDSIVLDSVSANRLMRKYNVEFDEVKIPFEYPLSFAVKKDNTILRSILDKTLTTITAEENKRIIEKWM